MTPRHTASKRPGALPSCRCAPAGATGSAGEEPFQGVTNTAEKHTKRREAASGWDPNGESSHVTSGGVSRPRGQPGRSPGLARSCHGQGTEEGPAWSEQGALREVGVGRPRRVFGREGDSGHTRPSGKGRTLALAADLFNEHMGLISGSAFAHGKLIFWDQPTESGPGVPGPRDAANTQHWFLSGHRGLPEQKWTFPSSLQRARAEDPE